jgi:hypothetical protein
MTGSYKQLRNAASKGLGRRLWPVLYFGDRPRDTQALPLDFRSHRAKIAGNVLLARSSILQFLTGPYHLSIRLPRPRKIPATPGFHVDLEGLQMSKAKV